MFTKLFQYIIFVTIAASLSSASRYGHRDPYCTVTVRSEITDDSQHYEIVEAGSALECPNSFTVLYFSVIPESEPPRLLTVFKPNKNIGLVVYNVISLDTPYAEETGYFSRPLNYNRFTFFNSENARSVGTLTGIVYDHISTLLYVFHNNGTGLWNYVDVYMLESKDGVRNIPLFRLPIDSIFYGVHWSFDAYSQRALYHKLDIDMETGRTVSNVYSIPFNSFLRHLNEGTPGQSEPDFEYDPLRSVIYKVNNASQKKILFISAFGLCMLAFVVLVFITIIIIIVRFFICKSKFVNREVNTV